MKVIKLPNPLNDPKERIPIKELQFKQAMNWLNIEDLYVGLKIQNIKTKAIAVIRNIEPTSFKGVALIEGVLFDSILIAYLSSPNSGELHSLDSFIKKFKIIGSV